MSDANVVKLLQPGSFADPLTEVLRNGARALLAQAIEAEVAEFLAKHVDLKTATGLRRVVRHGHLPEREVMTGIGPVGVRQPRVRDRGAADDAGRIRFTPAILPPYARRSRSLEVLIPILYLKGISTGDFEEALAALLGKDAPGLSASTIARLKEVWLDEHEHWRKRDLSAKRYVYVWADGIYLQARLEDTKQCILVIIGATPEGKKELLGFTDGARESAQDWRELLLDLQNRGLAVAPELAVADGALGFWKALGELWPTTREQRCWVHKTATRNDRLEEDVQRFPADPGLDAEPAAGDERAHQRGHVRTERAVGRAGEHGKRDAVLRARVRIEQDGNQDDGVAEEDGEERLRPVHARRHQTRGEHVGRNAVRHADPQRGVVVGGPVAARRGAPARDPRCTAGWLRRGAVSISSTRPSASWRSFLIAVIVSGPGYLGYTAPPWLTRRFPRTR